MAVHNIYKVKPVLSGHSKMDKTKVLKTNPSLMQVESIAAFYNTFVLHLAITGLENQFLVFLTGLTVFFTYVISINISLAGQIHKFIKLYIFSTLHNKYNRLL